MLKEIKSTQNNKVKDWCKLKRKSGRRKQQAYLLESWHLVGTAIATHQDLKLVMTTREQYQRHIVALRNISRIVIISQAVAKKLGSTKHPQGMYAIVPLSTNVNVDPSKVSGSWLILDRIQDPGNIGTMVRTADAAGFSGVVFGSGTASRFNPKVVRAMQGSQFHVRLVAADVKDWITAFQRRHLPVYGTVLNPKAVSFRTVEPTDSFALIMGNEGHGMQSDLLKMTDKNLYIPIKGHAESLNVAVAAGILMFQLER